MCFASLEGGKNILPHCGKCTNATGMVQVTAITPIQVRPVAVENLVPEKNNNCVNPPPKLPPEKQEKRKLSIMIIYNGVY